MTGVGCRLSHATARRRRGSVLAAASALALATALAATACTTVPQPIPGLETPSAEAPAPEPAKPSPEQVSAVPIPDRQIGAAVGQLDALATDLLDATHVPGLSVAVVHNGETLYAKGFGVRSVAAAERVDADTAFPLGGVSQPLAATVAASHMSDADLSWDTPVRQLIPTFAVSDGYVSDQMTIGDLFAQRSGLPADAGELAASVGLDRQQLLDRLRYLPLSAFRDSFAQSAAGVTAAGEAIAQSAGSDWASLAQRLLYEPLGMSATTSRSADYLARANRAASHVPRGDAFTVAPEPVQPDALSPATGATSSANDMARWMTMVLGRGSDEGDELIASADLLPALSPQSVQSPPATADARADNFGFGFAVSTSAAGRVLLESPTATGAAFTVIPSADVGIVVLANAEDAWVPAALTAQFADLVQFGEQTQDWSALARAAATDTDQPRGTLVGATQPANPTPAKALTSYDGVYANDFFGPATVATSNDTLTLAFGPDATKFELRHWDGDTFTMTPPLGAGAPGSISRVVFRNNSMSIEYLDENGLGTFSRN